MATDTKWFAKSFMTVNTCKIDFKNRSVLDPCSKNLSVICFILFNPISSPSFKHSDDNGMRIMVESDGDHDIFWPIIIGLNWSQNRPVKLVPEKSCNSSILFMQQTNHKDAKHSKSNHPRKLKDKSHLFTHNNGISCNITLNFLSNRGPTIQHKTTGRPCNIPLTLFWDPCKVKLKLRVVISCLVVSCMGCASHASSNCWSHGNCQWWEVICYDAS